MIADNPFKESATLVKRVLYTENETAEFFSPREGKKIQVVVPPGHVWIEGDNKDQSRDSRDFGPMSLQMIDGIARVKVWPLN